MSDIVFELSKNEYLISRLYHLYAKLLPEMGDYWEHLAKEELRHQQMIVILIEQEKEGKVHIDKNRFKMEPILLVQNFLNQKIDETKSKHPTIGEALSMAINVEGSLLEKKIFDIFETDSPELKNLLVMLHRETEDHLRSVTEKFNAIQ